MAQPDTDLSLVGRKKRPIPCNECKFHRRKCVRKSNNVNCERCIRLKRECINVPRNIDNDDELLIDGDFAHLEPSNHEVVSYNQQLKVLQDQILILEKALKEAKILRNLTYSSSDSDSMSSGYSEAHAYSSPSSPEDDLDSNERQVVPIRKTNKRLESSKLTYSWTLSMSKNGIVLNTNVKSIEDLITFGVQALQYLDGAALYTEPRDELKSLSLRTTNRSNNIHFSFQEALKNNKGHGGIANPAATSAVLSDQENVILNLVRAFFTCYNTVHPMVYKSLYYERYRTTEEKIASPLTTAMCAVMTLRPCQHIPYQRQELRQMGDYFYSLARESLSDIIDEPSQAMEASMGFMLLSHYSFLTLRFSEARHYSTTAYLVAHNAVGHVTEIDVGDIEQLAMKRNYIYLSLQESALKHFVQDDAEMLDVKLFDNQLEILPEDSNIAKAFLTICNHLMTLLRSRQMLQIMGQLQKAQSGKLTEFSLDAFFKLQQLIRIWWADMPIEVRTFQDPFEPEKEEGGYHKLQYTHQAMALIVFHSFEVSVHSCFIPNESTYLHEQKSSIYSEHANAIHHQAMRICLDSSKAIIAISQRIMDIGDVCRPESDFLMGVLETLAVLTSCPDKYIAQEATILIQICFAQLRKTLFQDMVSVPDTLVIGQKPDKPDKPDKSDKSDKPDKPDKNHVPHPTYHSCPSPATTIMWESMVRSLAELGIKIESKTTLTDAL